MADEKEWYETVEELIHDATKMISDWDNDILLDALEHCFLVREHLQEYIDAIKAEILKEA